MNARKLQLFAGMVLTLAIMLSMQAPAVTYLSESFEGTWTGYAPSTWTYDMPSGSAYWERDNGTGAPCYGYPSVPGSSQSGSYCAYFGSFCFSSGAQGRMISPVMNMSAATGGRIAFYFFRGAGYTSTMDVQVSSNGGTSWTTLFTTAVATYSPWTLIEVLIPAIYRTANTKIAFKGNADWWCDMWLDNVIVDDTPVYCMPTTMNIGYMGIQNVTMSTLNNTSTCPPTTGYTMFNSPVTLVYTGQTYVLNVTGCSYPQYFTVFVDWNKNGLFTDAGETFNSSTYYSQGVVCPINVTVPTTALVGTSRMRVYSEYYGYSWPASCGPVNYGEAEDYLLNVQPGMNTITANPILLTFMAEDMGPVPTPKPLAVATSPTQFAWTTAITANPAPVWMSVTPSTGTGNTTTSVAILRTNMTPGIYNGSIRFSGSSALVDVPVSYGVEARVKLSPASNPTIVKLGCAPGGTFTKNVLISNIGGHFNGGVMNWTATTGAPEINILTPTGTEGGNLVFTVSTAGMMPGTTIARTIDMTAVNSVSGIAASNSPYTLDVRIEMEPSTPSSITNTIGAGYTGFTNSAGQLVAQVSSNSGSIPFTVNVTPCQLPSSFSRLRYVRRIYSFSTSAASPSVNMRLYYSLSEAVPYVTVPAALRLWRQAPGTALWTNMGGTSDAPNQFVEVNALSSITGTFALAHPWVPKTMQFDISSAVYDRASKNVVLQWRSPIDVADEGYFVERIKDSPDGPEWETVGSVAANVHGDYGYIERVTEEGLYYYRLLVADKDGNEYQSQPIAVNVSSAPVEFALAQNYPNPFNPTTAIRFSVPVTTHVTLKVYDLMWREVATVVEGVKTAGEYEVSFDASSLPSGLYLYRLEADGFSAVKKMNLMK